MSVVKNVGLAKSKSLMVASRWLTAVNELHVCMLCAEPFSLTNRVSETEALMVWVDAITFPIKTRSSSKCHVCPNSLIRHFYMNQHVNTKTITFQIISFKRNRRFFLSAHVINSLVLWSFVNIKFKSRCLTSKIFQDQK